MDNLYEDLHWLVLIVGYFLADESTGETPLIPQEIITYSLSVAEQTDTQATLATLFASQVAVLGKKWDKEGGASKLVEDITVELPISNCPWYQA